MFSDNEEPTKKMSFQYKKADPKNWAEKAAGMIDKNKEEFKFYALTMYEDIYSFEDCPKS